MTPEQAQVIAQFLIPELESEYQITRRVLAAVPDDQAAWQPHERNMKAGELATHVAFVEMWFYEGIVAGVFTKPDDAAMTSLRPSEAAALYAEKVPVLLEQIKGLSAGHLAKTIEFFTWNLPAVAYLQFAQKHTVHHRGQLSVYLRPMGAKVPSIYGGSADEPMTAAKQA